MHTTHTFAQGLKNVKNAPLDSESSYKSEIVKQAQSWLYHLEINFLKFSLKHYWPLLFHDDLVLSFSHDALFNKVQVWAAFSSVTKQMEATTLICWKVKASFLFEWEVKMKIFLPNPPAFFFFLTFMFLCFSWGLKSFWILDRNPTTGSINLVIKCGHAL